MWTPTENGYSYFADLNSTDNEFNPFRKEKNAEKILLKTLKINQVEVYYLKLQKHEISLHLSWKISLLIPSLARMNFTLVFISGSTQVKNL